MKIPKELIKEYVKSENFTNTTDIMESIKSMFADVLNEVCKCQAMEMSIKVQFSSAFAVSCLEVKTNSYY